jgi:hypothetical protein
MIVEYFKNDDPVRVYRRFRDWEKPTLRARVRLAPDGLIYVFSWVDEKIHHCIVIN